MKKIIMVLCIIAMMVTFNACNSDQKNESDSTASAVTTEMEIGDSSKSDENPNIIEGKDSSNSEEGSHIVGGENSSNSDESELILEDEVEIVLEEGQEMTGF